MAEVRVDIKPDKKTGEYAIFYECAGFQGNSCDTVAEIMSSLGTIQDKKTTDDAYQHEIPVPVPNRTLN